MQIASILQPFLSFALILLAAQLGAWFFRKLGQPSVVGEITGGIFLGPSALGYCFPELMRTLLPASAQPLLSMSAQPC